MSSPERFLPPRVDVTFRAIHGSKGLEADYVLLPNLTTGTYSFPSTIADDPVLRLALTEAAPYPHAEDRRLLYVAHPRPTRGDLSCPSREWNRRSSSS